MDVAEIYRNIGKILRSYGASRIYIVKSKTIYYEADIKLSLELIADRIEDLIKAENDIQKMYTNVQCMLYDGENPDYYALIQEAEEDGIQL